LPQAVSVLLQQHTRGILLEEEEEDWEDEEWEEDSEVELLKLEEKEE